MLETLLQIGKTFREAKRLRHHRYIKPAPKPDKKTNITFLSLPVKEDFSFDFNGLRELLEAEREHLFYPTFKTGEADGLVKYLFGDILYGRQVDPKSGGIDELGFYRMGDPSVRAKGFQVSSFNRCLADALFFTEKSTVIRLFRSEFQRNLSQIESLMVEKANKYVYLHFDFDGKHWFDFGYELELMNEKILADFLSSTQGGYVLEKFLHKTIGGDTPNFDSGAKHKVKLFNSTSEVLDLIYAIDYSKKAAINENNIKIVVLPRGKDLKAGDIEKFFERPKFIESESVERAEEDLEISKSSDFDDSLFTPVIEVPADITQYDFIFSKRADSPSTPDVDVLEISGIQKSNLAQLSRRIRDVRFLLDQERKKLYPKWPKSYEFLDIRSAFKNILGDSTKGQKKYQSHLFKTLPKIYTGTYFQDQILLPAFISKVEYELRNDEKFGKFNEFNFFKYQFFYLLKIQNTNQDRVMELKTSKSYRAGLLLGKMAKPLSSKINSFEKNYVGMLSRRISDKRSALNFANFINEKLIMHEATYMDVKAASVEFAKTMTEIADNEYLKNECAFGFFESYFANHKTENQEQQNYQTQES